MRSELEQVKAGALGALVSAMEAKARYLKRDGVQIGRLCERMAAHLGLAPDQVEEVRNAGLLHDIGMINTPESILEKSGPLTEREREQVRNHTVVGAGILLPLPYLGRAIEYTRYHHERLDGSGYPEGLRGEEIPLGARIVGVADCYVAMTDDRPFRPALSPAEALQILRAIEGVWFDRRVVDSLRQAVVEARVTVKVS